MARHIAIVEDEPAIRENYRDMLEKQGYNVSLYGDRPSALTAFEEKLPELVVIDIGLDDEVEGGFDLCRELRSKSPDLPIIFLTARDSELDQISGLRLGADDYLTKDISLPYLLARIIALFRRVDTLRKNLDTITNSVIKRGHLEIDQDRMTMHWKETHVDLTVTEFWLIHAMAKHPGHVKSRQQLMDAASVVLDDNTITSHIKRVRKKFQSLDANFEKIETVYGMGYRWRAIEEG